MLRGLVSEDHLSLSVWARVVFEVTEIVMSTYVELGVRRGYVFNSKSNICFLGVVVYLRMVCTCRLGLELSERCAIF